MPELYSQKSSYPKPNAQMNLQGRTHYVDDDTLRYFRSRVITARHVDSGLLFYVITSDALDMRNTKRGFRFAIFDLFGAVLARTELDQAFRTSRQAEKALWAELDKIDAAAVTLAAIEQATAHHDNEMERLRDVVASLANKD